jgi:glycosyltransferase involved in cell wall biosynthesis
MNVTILHYHLNPGGVTRIISSQVAALDHCTITILTGADHDTFNRRHAEIRVFPALNYVQPGSCSSDSFNELLHEITAFLHESLAPGTYLHVHNSNLGKNPVLTCAVYLLAQEGCPILFHCHDFAEDRPENMAFMDRVIRGYFTKDTHSVMYPTFPHCAYAVLTEHDRQRLEEYGIPAHRIHHLPNPVVMPSIKHISPEEARSHICTVFSLDPGKIIITCPIRVIRRKNIGELLLLAALYEGRAEWLVTLPPQNPVEQEEYHQWVKLNTACRLPVIFEAGLKIPFEEIMYGSDLTISTSIREGFGMAFLEPWLYGKTVTGRNLPSVTCDFTDAGIVFPHLYDRLAVPTGAGTTDFPCLPLADRMACIRNASASTAFREKIFEINPELDTIFISADTGIIQSNKHILTSSYSLGQYGKNLHKTYSSLS